MLETIPTIPLFQDLGVEQLSLLKPLFERYSCPADTIVFEQGDPAVFLYLILQGKMAIRYKPYDSPPIILTHLNAGDAFGWSAVVGRSTYTSTLICEARLEAIRINGADLRKLCIQQPETGKIVLDRLARLVSKRWKDARKQVKYILDEGMAKGKR
jgi:CRP-like cAMP-binding protein